MIGGVVAAGPSPLWFLTRGSGIVALLLLTGGIVLGVMGPTGFRTPRWPRFVAAGLHKNVTLLGLAFVVVHVITTVADTYAPVSLTDAVIPFVSAYRPVWIGLGAVAFDLLLALIATSLLRSRIGLRAWQAVHWLAYASWPVALLHSLASGSDARTGWMMLLAAACTVTVAGSLLWRVVGVRQGPLGIRIGAGLAAVVLPLAGVAWYRSGPLEAGWARRSGTPAALLGSAVAVRNPIPARAVPAIPTGSFRARLVGRFAQAGPDGNGLTSLAIAAVTRGKVAARLRIDLWGQSLQGGGVSMSASRVTFGPALDPKAYTGQIVQLAGTRVLVSLEDAAGDGLALDLSLHIDRSAQTVGGLLRATPAG